MFWIIVFVIDHVLADVVKVLRLRCILWFMGCRVNRFVTDERNTYMQTSAHTECTSSMESAAVICEGGLFFTGIACLGKEALVHMLFL